MNVAVFGAGAEEREVCRALSDGELRQQTLMTKATIALMGDQTKIQTFNKWKVWVKTKKMWRYHLDYCEKRIEQIYQVDGYSERYQPNFNKETLSQAFKKWKMAFSVQEEKLQSRPYIELQDRCIYTNKAIHETKEELLAQEDAIKELNNQNRVLVDNTISGQKLALSI